MTADQIITIEKMINGGYGLGRLPDGMVVLVPFVIPGEKVRITPLQKKKTYFKGKLLEIITASPDRVRPGCPIYGECGGCDLQHIAYQQQLLLKEAILSETLDRAKIPTMEGFTGFMPSLPSPREYGYRQRIRLQVGADGRVGFFRTGSHEIIPTACCPIARDEINTVLQQLPGNPGMERLLRTSTAIELILSPADRQIFILLHVRQPPGPPEVQEINNAMAAMTGVKGLALLAKQEIYGPFAQNRDAPAVGSAEKGLTVISIPEEIAGQRLTMLFELGGFCQINQEQNENMLKQLLAWSGVTKTDRVLDLYCGMGNLSIPMALLAGEVIGLDQQGSAIRSARLNAAAAGLTNCRFTETEVVAGTRRLLQKKDKFDLIILDPPRQGCPGIPALLPGFAAERLLYISCDPATLARDLAQITGQGFKLEKIGLLDMFPQTHHLECMALLVANPS